MKTKQSYLLLIVLLLHTIGFAQNASNNIFQTTPVAQDALSQRLRQQQQSPAGTSNDWYRSAMEAIQKQEYFFNSFSSKNEYSAFNRKQNLGFVVSPNGYSVRRFNPANQADMDWVINFTIASDGRLNHSNSTANNFNVKVNSNHLQYISNNLVVEYLNDEKGLRQNFIVKQKPVGKGSLELLLNIHSDLSVKLANNNSLRFYSTKKNGAVQMEYSDLKVWDANHQPVKASMELRNNGSQVAIIADDNNAQYPLTIDPLNKIPDWTDSGNGLLFPLLNDLTAHVMYGFSVSSAGDVNGDGIDDIIVGAPAYVKILSVSGGSFNPLAVGAAFLYYGHNPNGPSATPDEVMQPTTIAGALFGFSVSSAGDVNGDGYSDIVVGAPGDQASLQVTILTLNAKLGKVYIYYGGPSGAFDGNVNTTPTVSATLKLSSADMASNILNLPGIIGSLVNPLYGFSVSSAGDVNGDGKADILVGAPAYIDLLSLNITGRVDVYYGSGSGIGTTPGKIIKGGLLNALFGFTVSSAGDVNGDHYSDIIVGAPASLSVLSVGAAYVFHGGPSGITATNASGANINLQAPGLLNQTLFGYSVSNAGDVNGDGYADVIVGEPLSLEQTLSLQLVAIGQAHIFYGSSTGIVTTGATHLSSPRRPSLLGLLEGNLLFGFSVSGAGDLNCDGLADVIVGEPGGTSLSLFSGPLGLVNANAVSGRAYIYFGKTSKPANTPSWLLEDNNSSLTVANLVGASVARAGDINGDGKADVLIGAPNGTLDLGSTLLGIVGNALNYVTVNSVGGAYAFFGCLSGTSVILPVDLVSFTGSLNEATVVINWKTVNEINLSSFEVEHSTDGNNFETIALAFSNGGSNEYNYQVKDKHPAQGINYYRLKMIDIDGKFKYSEIVVVQLNGLLPQISVAPNPVTTPTFRITFNNMIAGSYDVDLRDLTGRLLYTRSITLTRSNAVESFQRTTAMSTGMYMVTIRSRNNNQSNSFKLIIQ